MKKAAKSKSKSRSSVAPAVKAVAQKAGLISGSGRASGGRRKRKSVYWYVRETARLKAKKAYERARLRI